MPKETGALQDIWTGWLDFWRESLSIVGVKTQGKGNKLEKTQVKLEKTQAVTRRNRLVETRYYQVAKATKSKPTQMYGILPRVRKSPM